MKTYKVDLDYENYLFDESYDPNLKPYMKINQSFEFAFFIVNKQKCKLQNSKPYPREYLARLKKDHFVVPEFTKEEGEPWWGQRKNKELEQKLNSKITSCEIAKTRQWGMFKGVIAHSLLEVLEHLEKHIEINHWIIRKPHGFSGIGHYFFESNKLDIETLKKVVQDYTVILEPAYKRVIDIGTTFELMDGKIYRQFMVENYNSPTGRFKGAMATHELENFKDLILAKYKYDLSELEEITKEICQIYTQLGATSNVQIDSFIYEENGQLRLYPLVEVNYRKTMGLVAQALADRHPDARFIEWKIYAPEEMNAMREVGSLDKIIDSHWYELSPEDSIFKSYYKKF